MIKKMSLLFFILLSCSAVFAEKKVQIPIVKDIAIGTEALLKYVSSVNSEEFDTLFVCNFSC